MSRAGEGRGCAAAEQPQRLIDRTPLARYLVDRQFFLCALIRRQPDRGILFLPSSRHSRFPQLPDCSLSRRLPASPFPSASCARGENHRSPLRMNDVIHVARAVAPAARFICRPGADGRQDNLIDCLFQRGLHPGEPFRIRQRLAGSAKVILHAPGLPGNAAKPVDVFGARNEDMGADGWPCAPAKAAHPAGRNHDHTSTGEMVRESMNASMSDGR